MIENAPLIKISGKKYSFYSLDFENNGSDSPSTMVVNYVNSSGVLEHIPLGKSKEITEIKVYPSNSSTHTFSFKGFAVSSKISERPGQN